MLPIRYTVPVLFFATSLNLESFQKIPLMERLHLVGLTATGESLELEELFPKAELTRDRPKTGVFREFNLKMKRKGDIIHYLWTWG